MPSKRAIPLCAWAAWGRLLAAAALCGAAIPAALAEPVKEYMYRPDAIYTVHTGMGIASQIEISPSEQVKDFGTGFTAAWDLARRDNVFYVKPKSLHADTNMYIRTNLRAYLLDLKVTGKKWHTLEQARRAGVNYRVRFTYPRKADAAVGEQGGVTAGTPWAHPAAGAAFHDAYDYAAGADSEWLVPEKVYDDGTFTYIHIRPGAQVQGGMPSVFGRKTETGEDFIVNTAYKDQRITVQGVYRYLVLRHGNHVLGLRRN